MARESEYDAFFNKPSIDEALRAVDDALNEPGAWKTTLRDLRMRVMVLALLLRFTDNEEWTAADIADQLAQFYPGGEINKRRKISDFLRDLLSPNRNRPPRDYKNQNTSDVLTLFTVTVADALKRKDRTPGDRYSEISEAIHADASTVGELFETAVKAAGLSRDHFQSANIRPRPPSKATPVHRKHALHVAPRTILDYLPLPFGKDPALLARDNSDEIKKKARELRDMITSRSDTRRITALTGRVHAGKTGALVELLRGLASELNNKEASLGLHIKTGGTEAFLPVLVLDTQTMSNRTLIGKVLSYLTFRDGKARTSFDETELTMAASKRRDTEALIEQLASIERLHKNNSALFVFLDWQVFNADSIRSLLRSDGRASVVQALHRSNPDSRFLITSVEKWKPDRQLDLPGIKLTKLNDPLFGEIRRYLPGLAYPPEFASQLDACQRLRGNRNVRGDLLLAMATALQLHAGEPEADRAVDAIRRFCAKRDDRDDDEVVSIFQAILTQLSKRGLLRPFLVVASSEDGALPDSLRQILENWHSQDPFPEGFDWVTTRRNMENLASLGTGFFLKFTRGDDPDPDEFDIAEPPEKDAPTFEVDAQLAEHIQRAILKSAVDDAGKARLRLLREARRQVAAFARKRSQTKRMRSVSWVRPPGIGHLKRDIQTYTALLASIDPDELAENPLDLDELPLLRMSDDAVFTIASSFRPALALRYALKCILRKEIDDDHDLTMVFDHDPMRLRLYLLLFNTPGQYYYWLVDDLLEPGFLDGPPDRIPAHLHQCFRPPEIMRLLATIAITAYHCQNARIVNWARQRAEELLLQAEENDRAHLFAMGVRVWCSYVDIAVQCGGLVDSSNDPDLPGHLETLAYVESWLQHWFADLEAQAGQGLPSDSAAGGPAKIRAWMRLKARQAELHALTGVAKNGEAKNPGLVRAGEIYAIIETLEHEAASLDGNEDPVVFSGRTARRYMRFLARPPAPGTSKTPSKDATLRALIEINKARLRRFGGADQVAVYLDEARYRRFSAPEELAQPLRLTELALNLCDQGFASHGVRLETLILLAELELAKAEQMYRAKGHGPALQSALSAVETRLDLVLKIADGLGFRPSSAHARLLKARCLLLGHPFKPDDRNRLIEVDDLFVKATTELKECADRSYDDEIEALKKDLPLDVRH